MNDANYLKTLLIVFSVGVLVLPTDLLAQQNKLKTRIEIDSRNKYFNKDNVLYSQEDISTGSVPPPALQNTFIKQSSSDSWVVIAMNYNQFNLNMRWEGLLNSTLNNPLQPISNRGLAYINFSGKIKNFSFQLGSIYDQFGKGMSFRSYEIRSLLLDNVLIGGLLKYQWKDVLDIKVIYGSPKRYYTSAPEHFKEWNRNFFTYESIISGVNIENQVRLGPWFISQGFSFLNNRLSDADIDPITTNFRINNQNVTFGKDVVVISYYNQIVVHNFSFGLDFNYKFKTPVLNYNLFNGVRAVDYQLEPGWGLQGDINYSYKNFSINIQTRLLHAYENRAVPFEEGNEGYTNFLPALSRLHTYRLTGRYAPFAYADNELAFFSEIFYRHNKHKWLMTWNNITTQENNVLLFREFYLEDEYKWNKKLTTIVGIQSLNYNEKLYQSKNDFINVFAYHIETKYKLNRKIRNKNEVSQLFTKEDLGSWLWLQTEWTIKKLTLALGDMYNYGNKDREERIHYYSFFLSYAFPNNIQASVAWTRQPETIVCSGGRCRVEPAFSGVSLELNFSF